MNGTDEPCFVDTNVWLYALIDSGDSSKTLVARDLLLAQSRPIITSTQVINEVCVNLIRKAGWDSLIVAAALQAKATTLFSEDMQDGRLIDDRLRISNPFV